MLGGRVVAVGHVIEDVVDARREQRKTDIADTNIVRNVAVFRIIRRNAVKRHGFGVAGLVTFHGDRVGNHRNHRSAAERSRYSMVVGHVFKGVDIVFLTRRITNGRTVHQYFRNDIIGVGCNGKGPICARSHGNIVVGINLPIGAGARLNNVGRTKGNHKDAPLVRRIQRVKHICRKA